MKKTWFKIFMGLFVLLFTGSCGVSYNVGGIVSKLADGETLVLQNNGGDDIEIIANGNFTFSATFLDGGIYDVTILNQPSNQFCSVNNGSGTINGTDVTDITIICSSVYTAITAGDSYTIALEIDGTVWAWGNNSIGQLGDGTTIDSTMPVQVSGLTNVTAVAAGSAHTIVLKDDGTVWTWGSNTFGQLGDGTTADSTTPVQVSGLTNVIAVAAESLRTIVLKNDGTVWVWGENSLGQLGVETTEICPFSGYDSFCSTTPVQVPGLTNVEAIAAEYSISFIALKNDGTVWTWGKNSVTPVQISSPTFVTATAVGLTPVQVYGLDVTAIATGVVHYVLLTTDGTAWALGENIYGQLGDGTTTASYTTPVQVSDLTDVVAIAVGSNHSIALKIDGTIWTWGDNSSGQLGNGTTIGSTIPVQIVTP